MRQLAVASDTFRDGYTTSGMANLQIANLSNVIVRWQVLLSTRKPISWWRPMARGSGRGPDPTLRNSLSIILRGEPKMGSHFARGSFGKMRWQGASNRLYPLGCSEN